MAGYKEIIEIDTNADSIEIVDENRTVDNSGRVSVGRSKAGQEFDKIVLIKDSDTIGD